MKKSYAGYEVNFIEEKILLSKKFAKAASILDSEEYKLLKRLREENPGFKTELREIKTNASQNRHRNLSYPNMRKFIALLEGENSPSLKELEKVEALSKTQPGPYAYVKTWFLKKYPNYQEAMPAAEETKPQLKLLTNG